MEHSRQGEQHEQRNLQMKSADDRKAALQGAGKFTVAERGALGVGLAARGHSRKGLAGGCPPHLGCQERLPSAELRPAPGAGDEPPTTVSAFQNSWGRGLHVLEELNEPAPGNWRESFWWGLRWWLRW